MKRAAIAVAVLLAAAPARADGESYLTPAVGVEGVSSAMLGDTREIIEGLGLPTDGRAPVKVVPRLTFGARGLGERRQFAIAVQASWLHDAMSTGSRSLVVVDVRRDVVPLALVFQLVSHPERHGHFVLAVGPEVAISRFSDRGWFGDSTSLKIGGGGHLFVGAKLDDSESLSVTIGLSLQVLWLPRHDELLRDGGTIVAGGPTLGFELGL